MTDDEYSYGDEYNYGDFLYDEEMTTDDEDDDFLNTNMRAVEYELIVDGFSLLNRKVQIKSLKILNHYWDMLLYPDGDSNDSKGYISLFIDGYSFLEVRAVVTFTLLNNKGAIVVSSTLPDNYKAECRISKFFLRSAILNPENGILDKDALKIVCKIKWENNDEAGNDIPPRLVDDYETLLENSIFSDASLLSEGKIVKVHKNILASRSSVFAAMFVAEMKEKQENIVEIVDIKYDVLVEMLRFVYAGKVNGIDTLAAELAIAADKYALDDLKIQCENAMVRNLSPENVVECLRMADMLHMDTLKDFAVEFIVEKVSETVEKPEFTSLPPELAREISRRCLAKNRKQ